MATLFFEGFEKGLVFNKLDPAYWKTQFKQFPKYAFAGIDTAVSYINDTYSPQWGIAPIFKSSSPNQGILPTSLYDGYSPYSSYPGVGTPPGFLAFTNIDLYTNELEYPTYIQLSGFPQPSGDKVYFGFRALGLENKNTDYSSYPHKHTLFTMCSGDNINLTASIVKITGNNFNSIAGQKSTLALEISQNDETLGYFDYDISGIIPNYRIASVGTGNRVYTIATTDNSTIVSRWSHSELLVDDSDQQQSYLSIKLEGIDLAVVDDDPALGKEEWALTLPISGFKFDNIRFYNRTYTSTGLMPIQPFYTYPIYSIKAYYNYGFIWLLDDITLIDNVGEPSYYLGPTSKVMQLVPGINNSLNDNSNKLDGILGWDKIYSSVAYSTYRAALTMNDADAGSIQATSSGDITSIAFGNRIGGFLPDQYSRWRDSFNDAIGGIKIYNSARKSYLDTQFCNVYLTGISDPYETNVSLCLHMDSLPIKDSSRSQRMIESSNSIVFDQSEYQFGGGSILFPDSSAYLRTDHPDFALNNFTIDSWIYFNNTTEKIALFDKYTTIYNSYAYNFYATISGIEFRYYQNDNVLDSGLLSFPENANTGIWEYVSIVRNTGEYTFTAYLNGQSGIPFSQNTLYKNLQSANSQGYPPPVQKLTIGKAGRIDELVITTGLSRYGGNFTAPTSQYKALKDDHISIGPNHSVGKTTYSSYQYYLLKNPATNQNWTLAEVSGIVLGVKKL
jgi:hypothetical protein